MILHLAGVTRGDEDDLRRNSAMIAPLLAAARKSAAARVLFASTAAVYGRCNVPAREGDEPQPIAPYGAAKLAAERLLQTQRDMAVSVLRIGNVVGADALLGAGNVGREVVLDPVAGREGGPVRSWIGPRQFADAIAQLAVAPLPAVLNLAADPPLAMASLLDAADRQWRYGPPRPGVLEFAALDTSLLQSLCQIGAASPEGLAAEAAWALGVLQ